MAASASRAARSGTASRSPILTSRCSTDADATKRDLVDYLDAMSGPLIAVLADRPLSVIRVLRGQDPFMQKNVPKYTPDVGAHDRRCGREASKREVSYALCDDRRTLLWFANQRAVEYHPTLVRAEQLGPADLPRPRHRPARTRPRRVRARGPGRPPRPPGAGRLGLAGAVKTSGAKGVHVFVPLDGQPTIEDAAAATRALAARAERLDPDLATTAFIKEDRHGKVFIDSTRAGGATVAAAYSPRIRPGAPVSFPVPWDRAWQRHASRLHVRNGGRAGRRQATRGLT